LRVFSHGYYLIALYFAGMEYRQKIRFNWTRKTTANMGRIDADIELINGNDAEAARKHIIGEDELRRMPISLSEKEK
jgi:hypothetical protein